MCCHLLKNIKLRFSRNSYSYAFCMFPQTIKKFVICRITLCVTYNVCYMQFRYIGFRLYLLLINIWEVQIPCLHSTNYVFETLFHFRIIESMYLFIVLCIKNVLVNLTIEISTGRFCIRHFYPVDIEPGGLMQIKLQFFAR